MRIARVTGFLVLATALGVGLVYSHRYAYRYGARQAMRPVATALMNDDEDADSLHLYFGVLTLHIYAKHPEAGSAEMSKIRSLTSMWADGVQGRVIPRLRREGRIEEADRLAGQVREARSLLASSTPGKK